MKAKKSLGQNFLKSKKVAVDMANSSNLSSKDLVLEIGPGKGFLTEKFLETGAKVFAVETDKSLIPLLEEKFVEEIKNKKLVLINQDILDFDPAEFFKNGKYKIISNIPYYITGLILRKFLEASVKPSVMTLLVQKEVAERIVCRDKKESILSLSVKIFGEPRFVSKVSKRYFSPEPKVDSAVVCIQDISSKKIKGFRIENYFTVVKQAFSQKRKTAIKNLSNIKDKELIKDIFKELGLSEKVRAEDISLDSYIKITKKLFPHK